MPLIKENSLLYEVIKVSTVSGVPVTVTGTVNTLQGLSVPKHDYISLAYSGSSLTGVVYKVSGSGGTTVGDLTLAYSGTVLTSVTRTV